jgi:mannose-6-phosphate isomerase-like protein (cupin superfamily)
MSTDTVKPVAPADIVSGVRTLIASFKDVLARHRPGKDPVSLEIGNVLSLLAAPPPLTGGFQESDHPVARFFDAALGTGNKTTAGLLDGIRPVIQFLPWRYSYPVREDAPGLEKNIAFAELIGPEAPFKSDTVCLGLTLIAPKTLYPAHQHPAVELYYVVTGTATWILNGEARRNPPGAFILHPSQGVHAMQTTSSPLLAIYTWSGHDIHSTSVYTRSARTNPNHSNP